MKADKSDSNKFSELRRRAEEKLPNEQYADLDELSPEDMRSVIHDLQVHQIQLEMQNEDLHLTQRRLEESRDKYSDLYDFAPVGYLTVSRSGLIMEANLTCAGLLGVGRGSLAKMPLSRFIARDDEDIFFLHRRRVFAERTQQSCELTMEKSDGTQFHAQLKSMVTQDADGEFKQCRIIVSDITELKRLQVELLRAQKLESLGVLAGGIAHDFNNILTAVLGNLSLVGIYTDPDKVSEKITAAKRACMRAKGLTQRLLTFSSGGAPIKRVVSVARVLNDSVIFALSGSNIRCVLSIPDDLWCAEVDPGQVDQAFSNILINARQAMPDGGIVEVRAENMTIELEGALPLKQGTYLKIAIQDHGVGIPAANLHQIFDPYFTTKQRGSGLGLATSYSIIKTHDGHISVESSPGAGSTFCIYLPASPGIIPVMQAKELTKLVSGRGMILVMDDEDAVSRLACDILGDVGYRVTAARDGDEAIDLYRKAREYGHPFDAVILDLTVPGGMGGKEAVHILMDIDPDVKAIVSSGYSIDPIMSDFRKYGFSGVIAKPYDAGELSSILNEVLAK